MVINRHPQAGQVAAGKVPPIKTPIGTQLLEVLTQPPRRYARKLRHFSVLKFRRCVRMAELLEMRPS
jgi:hypothetical protein